MISFSVMVCLPHTLQVLTSTYAFDPRLEKFRHPPGQLFWASSSLMISSDLVQASFGFKVKSPSLIMKMPCNHFLRLISSLSFLDVLITSLYVWIIQHNHLVCASSVFSKLHLCLFQRNVFHLSSHSSFLCCSFR